MKILEKKAKPIVIEKIGKVSSISVQKHTKKNWDQWIEILDHLGARTLQHKEIVSILKSEFKLTPWWQQIVTSQYEIFIGRKIEGRNDKGEWSTVTTASIPVSAGKCWKFLISQKGINIWLKPLMPIQLKQGVTFESLGEIYGEVRVIKAPQRIRLTWQETDWDKKSVVVIIVVPRAENKCHMAIQHEQLASKALKIQMLSHWKNILKEIKSSLK